MRAILDAVAISSSSRHSETSDGSSIKLSGDGDPTRAGSSQFSDGNSTILESTENSDGISDYNQSTISLDE